MGCAYACRVDLRCERTCQRLPIINPDPQDSFKPIYAANRLRHILANILMNKSTSKTTQPLLHASEDLAESR